MKRGFTLIELLAVIVILSVIAIITTTIISNIIEYASGNPMNGRNNIYNSGFNGDRGIWFSNYAGFSY